MAVILVSEPPAVANRVARMLTLSRTGVHRTGTAFSYMKGKIMDDETTEERDDAERDDLTPDEAHRAGEFDGLRDMLARVLDKIDAMNDRIDGIYDNFTDSVAQLVENGATVKENDDDAAEAIAEAAADDLENLDYTL
jgi:hypothetical protein